MANSFRKLLLLVWKNFILQIRRPIGTAVEILLPFAFLALLLIGRKFINEKKECFQTYSNQKQALTTPIINKEFSSTTFIAYYPMNNVTKTIMERVSTGLKLRLTPNSTIGKPFETEEDVINDAKEFGNVYLCAVIFQNVKEGILPKTVEYSIRFRHSVQKERRSWRTKFVYPFFQQIGPRGERSYDDFVHVQYQVDTAIIQLQTNSNSTAPQSLQQFPYPDYLVDSFVDILRGVFALVFILAYMYTAVTIVKELVAEKQFRLKESMKMMGLPNWIHWSAWFIKTLVFLLVCVILQTILIKAGKIMQFSEAGIVFLFLFLYILGTIFFLFCLSTLFSHAVRAMVFTAVIWFGSLGPYFAIQDPKKFEETSGGVKAACCLLPNSCLGIMIHLISQRESSQVGARLSNLNQKNSPEDTFTLAQCFLMLILDCILYWIATWYIENVFPGSFGIPRPFYFPFQPSYWCGTKPRVNNSVIDMKGKEMTNQISNFEEEPNDLKIGVSIRDLKKVFKGATGKKVAVNGLSLNIYKGQITALLGHNGAGKTTTMSILTGLFPASNGEAFVNGLNIATDMDGIRDSLGLCPQHNVLFDRLTVKEHLEFFCALKGVPKKAAKVEIQQMIDDIQLSDKANQKSATLSGGMKRKLNCAIALIGGSETVFLDEPTSGMDPYARRATWDLLQKYRANKTIVLTTHFMDEADYLGDRIAIMTDGKLRCCGTSLFLKKRFGVGYHMTIVKGPQFQENKTKSLIATAVPTSKIVGNVGAEMSYILHEDSTKYFKPLFQELEERKDEYGINSFGMSVTTLEEVFLKVGEGENLAVEDGQTHDDENAHLHHIDRQESKVKPGELLTGCALKATQFKAMFAKRFLNSKRERKAVITQIVIPLLLILCGFLLSLSTGSQADDPPLLLTLAMLKAKSVSLTGIHGDFRAGSDEERNALFQMSKSYLSSISVNAIDRTTNIKEIRAKNNGSEVNVLFARKPISASLSANNVECCDYKYLVLNQQCKASMADSASLESLCAGKAETFGYGQCMNGAADSIKNTNLSKWATYYDEYMLEDSSKDVTSYFDKTVVGLTIEDNENNLLSPEYITWFSNEALHTQPSALSAGSNSLLKYFMNDSTYGIKTTNHPLPRNTEEKSDLNNINGGNLVLVIFIVLGIGMLAASFITFIVTEKTSKAKHLQFISGVDSVSYWGATFCWDFINYMIPAVGLIILFAAFNLDDFQGELGEVSLVIILFGLSVLPFIYLTSFIFSSALIAYSVVALLIILLSIGMVIAVFICRIVNEDKIAEILHHVFLLIPTYAFPQSLRDISTNVNNRRQCTQNDFTTFLCKNKSTIYHDSSLSWELPGVGVHCLYMFLEFVIYFLLVILIEERFFLGFLSGNKDTHFAIREGEDSDVKAEKDRVNNFSQEDISNSALVVKDLTKVYRTNGITAVDHLSIGIPKGECFGLLGINGAGKTTTFGMLTGELGITGGTAFIHGYNIQTQLRQVQQRIGYCPQFDALVERLTGREMLRMFARLRGIPASLIEDVVNSAVENLNLSKWADKLCGDYSGGNKRKLSTAMALVGDPAVIFLDEPTSGMDPSSRRFLWNTLTSVMNTGHSIVLTSHSMEECEALCTRLVIMVNGQFKCLGSIQHLKSRFGQGFTLIMKISPSQIVQQLPEKQTETNGVDNSAYHHSDPNDDSTAEHTDVGYKKSNPGLRGSVGSIKNRRRDTIQVNYSIFDNSNRAKQFVESTFQGAYLIEERQALLQYQILNPSIRWSQLFGALEEHAHELGIVDYSISQTSLEQVFINFAKLQHSEDRVSNKSCCSCSCF